MLKLVVNKNDIFYEYSVDLNLNKNNLNNVNTIVLQDTYETIIINIDGFNSFNAYKKIIDLIINLDIKSVDTLKEHFDDIKDNKTFQNSDLTILEQLLKYTDFTYEIISLLDPEAGEVSDESIFINNSDEISQNEYSLTNRTQLQDSSTFLIGLATDRDGNDLNLTPTPGGPGIDPGTSPIDNPDNPVPIIQNKPDLLSSSDSGSSDTDNLTNNINPSFEIDLPSDVKVGDVIKIYNTSSNPKEVIGEHTVTQTDIDKGNANIQVGEKEDGSVDTNTKLTDGSHDLVTTITDESGNESLESSSLTVNIDTQSPSAPAVPYLKDESDTGTSNTDNLTKDTTPSIVIELPADAEVGDKIKIYDKSEDPSKVIGEHIVTSADLNGSGVHKVEINITSPLSNGEHELTTTVTDKAGNESEESSSLTIEIDTNAKAPTIIITDDIGDITGTLVNGSVTDDTKPTVTVSLPDDVVSGDTITLYDEGIEVGTHTVTQTEINNGNVNVEPSNPLGQGEHDLSVSITDQAGNESELTTPVTITVDTIAPNPGPTVDTQTTNDVTPVIKGTASLQSGDTLEVSVNGATYTVTTDSHGVWTLDTQSATPITGTLGTFIDGTYQVVAIHTDAAGNTVSDVSFDELKISVNDLIGSITDINTNTNLVYENAENGDTVGVTALARDLDTDDTVTYTLSDNADGRFTIDSSTGVVTVLDDTKLNYEESTSHVITVVATSSDGSTSSANMTINVGDNDGAGGGDTDNDIGTISDVNNSDNIIAENAVTGDTVGITALATDEDAGDTVTYT
ncbi:MAG: Ig-like domain-containing protein, partial [Campylobacterales bacterium]|nr:Ig-like domain-containing protein [Campylobacterales bacterium]